MFDTLPPHSSTGVCHPKLPSQKPCAGARFRKQQDSKLYNFCEAQIDSDSANICLDTQYIYTHTMSGGYEFSLRERARNGNQTETDNILRDSYTATSVSTSLHHM